MSSLTLSSFGSPTCSRVRKKTNFDSDSDSEILGSILGGKVENGVRILTEIIFLLK